MKRYVIAFVLVTMMLFGSFGTPAISRALVGGDNGNFPKDCSYCTLTLSYQINNVIYWMNGVEMDAMESAPMIKNDRTFILIRYVADNLPGVTLGWDGRERKVTVNTPTGKTVELFIDNPIAKVNGVDTQIDPNNPAVMPFIHADRTFLPFRFIGEMLGASDIKWHADTKTVDLIFQLDENCEWTEIGKILSKDFSDNDSLSISFDSECTGEGQTLIIPDINLKALNAGEFENPELFTIGRYQYECARFCLDDNKNVILWEAFPDGDCCPETPCCDWEVIETLEILSLCPGDTGTKILSVKNVCGDGTKPIHFTIEAIDDVLVSTKDFELGPDASKEIEVTITMPKDCEPGTTLEYKVKISSDCEEKTKEITVLVECSDCVPCCDFTTKLDDVPDSVCSGEEFSMVITTTNNCDDEKLTFKIEPATDGNYFVFEDENYLEFTLDPKRGTDRYIDCIMPENCEEGEDVEFKLKVTAFDSDGEECGSEIVSFTVECEDCVVCCDFTVEYGRVPPPVCAGEIFQVGLYLQNTCDDNDLTFKLKQDPDTKDKPGFGDIVDIKPREVTVDAGRTEMIKTLCEMPDDCTDGTKYTFKVLIEAYDEKGEKCGFKTIEYSVECKDCSSCCDFKYSVSEPDEGYCPSEEFSIDMNITNNCTEKDMNFRFAVGSNSNITEILPGSFTLSSQSGKSVKVDCKMPADCKEDQKVPFVFTLIALDDEGVECEREVITFHTYCDDCTCCDIGIFPRNKMLVSACPGEDGSYMMVITNNCENETKSINLSWDRSSGITTISPSKMVLKPKETQTVTIRFIMPECKVGSTNKFNFTANADGCEPIAGSFGIVCKDCTCCDISIYPYPKNITQACAGDTGRYTMVVENKCRSETKTIQLSWSRSSGISAVNPSSLTLKPGEKKNIILTYTMPSCKVGAINKFYFTATINDCDQVTSNFSLTCKNCVCCDVEAISLRVPTSMKGGATSTGMYYIKNNCNKSITVTLTPVGNITYIKPTTLTLKAGEKKSITLGLKMPVQKGTFGLKYATFKFKISMAGCDAQEVSFKVNYQ
jgi:uncharacterized membrane protein